MEFLKPYLDTITLRQVFDFIVGAIAILSVVVEFSKKIPFHPWSFILSYFGKALNSDIKKKLDELEQTTDANIEAIKELKQDMEQKFKENSADADTKEAKRLRSRIIEFADSCRVHQKHTKTAFENTIRDYDDYMDYCEKHDIPNHFIDAEYEYIKSVYSQCQAENKFV